MDQLSFASLDFAAREGTRITEMAAVVPLGAEALIEPHFRRSGRKAGGGFPTIDQLRIYCLQQWTPV